MGGQKIDFDYVLKRVPEVGAGRLVLVYNPRSSKAQRVEAEVIAPVETAFSGSGIQLVRYEVLPTHVDDNAEKLAEILQDGDVVLTAGGDGTAAIGLNGAMLSGKQLHFWALPYGNFNDMARSLRKAVPGSELYPLEAIVDGKHFRFAACYFTMGLFAESTEVFDGDKVRKSLQTGKKGLVFSVFELAKWYFENKKRTFLPKFHLERNWKPAKKSSKASDYLAVNGVSVAKMMRGGRYYANSKSFLSSTGELTNFLKLCVFMGRSILFRVPGKESNLDRLIFSEPATIEIQAEGEYKKIEVKREIVFQKTEKSIKIL